MHKQFSANQEVIQRTINTKEGREKQQSAILVIIWIGMSSYHCEMNNSFSLEGKLKCLCCIWVEVITSTTTIKKHKRCPSNVYIHSSRVPIANQAFDFKSSVLLVCMRFMCPSNNTFSPHRMLMVEKSMITTFKLWIT